MSFKEVRRHLDTSQVYQAVKEMVAEASFDLVPGVVDQFKRLAQTEKAPAARETYRILIENARIASEKKLALCQDCGAAIVFLEIGSDVVLEGVFIEEKINQAVAEAYCELYLRKSVVKDPFKRDNTGDNTPVFIHTELCPGKDVRVSVYLKGGGSENMTRLNMFRPTCSVEEIIDYIAHEVKSAGPNPCPPLFLGVGIGGTADVAVLNSKKAVLRGVGTVHTNPFYRDLEKRIAVKVNATGVGPLGFGGVSTVIEVYIMEAPCHIASLPVALNMNCHSLRYRSRAL